MIENLKSVGLMILWVASWFLLILGAGFACKLVYKVFSIGWNVF